MATNKKSTNSQPEPRPLRWQRRQKVKDGVAQTCLVLGPGLGSGLLSRRELLCHGSHFHPIWPPPSSSFSCSMQGCAWQPRAALQGDEHRDSCAAFGEQAAAAGTHSRTVAPHSPRGHGQALLQSLPRRAGTTLSRITAVTRGHGRQ